MVPVWSVTGGVSCSGGAVRRSVGGASAPHIKPAALGVSLFFSAYLMVTSNASSGLLWPGWFSLLPLFVAIRTLRPVGAMLSGAFWGLCLYGFAVTGAGPAIVPGLAAPVLLTAVPAIYAFVGAWLTRRIGFSPFVLGAAWMGVELAFEPLGLRGGLLTGIHGDGTLLAWAGHGLGYVLVAFLVALVNASLLCVLSGICIGGTASRFLPGSGDFGSRLFAQTLPCFSQGTQRTSQPRAPPILLVHSFVM